MLFHMKTRRRSFVKTRVNILRMIVGIFTGSTFRDFCSFWTQFCKKTVPSKIIAKLLICEILEI